MSSITIAEIYGKLASYEGMEDLLTSDVFGTFRYLRPKVGLLPCLKKAVNIQGNNPGFLDGVVKAEYHFWPMTTRLKRESDLLIMLHKQDNSRVAILIEAKYLSGKSNLHGVIVGDEPVGDQLRDQYNELMAGNLVAKAPASFPSSYYRDYPGIDAECLGKAKKYLFYVTGHYAFPLGDIEESFADFPWDKLSHIFWLSWHDICTVIKDLLLVVSDEQEKLLLYDLLALLTRKRLEPFQGWSGVEADDVIPLTGQSNYYFPCKGLGGLTMATGAEIKKIYDAMKEIYIETGSLIKVVNDMFGKHGFRAVGDSGVMWGSSMSFLNAEKWLPYFAQRVFIRENAARAVGVNIMFDSGANEVPYITCAYICAKEGQAVAKSDEFFDASRWALANTVYEAPFSKTDFTKDLDYKGKFSEIICYSLPLDCFGGAEAIEKLIIQPLLLAYEQDFAGMKRAFTGAAFVGPV